MKENICKQCEGRGYFTDVISIGLSDPNDPYHKPHIERCDTCQVFEDDEQAAASHKQQAASLTSYRQQDIVGYENK